MPDEEEEEEESERLPSSDSEPLSELLRDRGDEACMVEN
jgi:hypothetical protein